MPAALSDETSALTTFGVFLAVGALELFWPSPALSSPSTRRWFGNVALYLIGGGMMLLPATVAFTAALVAHAMHFGLLASAPLPSAVAWGLCILGLDALYYGSHRLEHNVGFLWRIHAVHHSDPEMDVTTNLRHHPLEVVFDSLLVGGAALVIGISPGQVAAYALLSTVIQTLAHANIAMPAWLEAPLGMVFVTPGFHQMHHSREMAETNSNYGQVFVFWDRLFGSASGRTNGGARQVEFGLDDFRDARSQRVHRLLLQPVLPQGASSRQATQASGTTRNRSVSPVS